MMREIANIKYKKYRIRLQQLKRRLTEYHSLFKFIHDKLVQQICEIVVPFTIKAWHLADSYCIPYGLFLDIGTSQICPGAEIAAILQNGWHLVLLCLQSIGI